MARIVIPVFSLQGDVLGMYGRKITPGLREGTPGVSTFPDRTAACGMSKCSPHRMKSFCAKR